MAFRSNVSELNRPDRNDRWDRDRFFSEQDRDHDRYSDVRDRFEADDDHVYRRRGAPPSRDQSERRYRRHDDDESDVLVRERRRVTYDDEPHFERRRLSPPGSDFDRRVLIQRERERYHSPSPPRRRPTVLRRQSSLDTYDRRPRPHYERDYSPPNRRDEYRIPPGMPIPLPRSKALPPPRMFAERERDFYEEVQVADPYHDDFHGREQVREREIVRTRRRRSHSRSSRATSHRRSSSRSSSSSSSTSDGGTTITSTTRSEYPKKGKTRIPARLVSKRALIDLGYPYTEEGNTIIVQKALGQQNIDDLLKLSDDYKKSELELIAARSSAGDIIEERRTEIVEVPAHHHHHHQEPVIVAAAPPPAPAPAPSVYVPAPAPVQQIPAQVTYAPTTAPVYAPAPAPVYAPAPEVVKTAVVRDVSPARSYATTSYDSTTSYDTSITSTSASTATLAPVIVDGGHPHAGAIVLAERPRHRSRSRHARHGSRDLVRAERLSTGELVLYEEEVERVEEPSRGVRIEKDRKGRMSISVPKYR